ncbi:MICOS complex subunit MIC27 isoform X1 [Periplaneta americana]|uniref:MICOS complex subunit MIC27 isoform X1 n=1 Tax=Periplaneta americana TaxID=6978 RepID=UPI0037E9C10B
MFHCKQILRKFLLPGRYALFGAAVAVTAEGEKAVCNIGKAIDEASKADSTCKHCEAPAKLRPSELPIYESPEPGRIMEVKEEEPSSLEKTICAVRKEVWAFYGQYKDCQQKVIQFVETGKAHSESTLSFLREEATPIHRAGAIGVSGIAGLIMGLRGGWFKRILYGATGATAMAALCYPRQSAEIANESLQMAKYYFTVAYNFIYGVKPEGFKFLSPPPPSVDSAKSSTKGSRPVADEIPLPTKAEPENPVQQVVRDQSNPADKDLYTTRK